MAGCRCGWLLTYTAALSKDSRHHAASTSTGFASDFRRTRRRPNQPRNFSALRRYVGRIRSSLQSRCQPIINSFVLPLSYSAQKRPLPQAYAPCGCEARGHAYGGDGRIRTSVRRVCSRVTHTRLFLPGGAERNYRLCHISMRGVLVFPSRQIFSVPRFCQQITGAITASRLEGLTSGLRITHTAVPLNARHSRCPRKIGGIGGDRTHDLLITNELLCQLSYDTGSPPCLRPGGRADVRWRGLRPVAAFLRELHAGHRVRCSELTGASLLTDGHI